MTCGHTVMPMVKNTEHHTCDLLWLIADHRPRASRAIISSATTTADSVCNVLLRCRLQTLLGALSSLSGEVVADPNWYLEKHSANRVYLHGEWYSVFVGMNASYYDTYDLRTHSQIPTLEKRKGTRSLELLALILAQATDTKERLERCTTSRSQIDQWIYLLRCVFVGREQRGSQ